MPDKAEGPSAHVEQLSFVPPIRVSAIQHSVEPVALKVESTAAQSGIKTPISNAGADGEASQAGLRPSVLPSIPLPTASPNRYLPAEDHAEIDEGPKLQADSAVSAPHLDSQSLASSASRPTSSSRPVTMPENSPGEEAHSARTVAFPPAQTPPGADTDLGGGIAGFRPHRPASPAAESPSNPISAAHGSDRQPETSTGASPAGTAQAVSAARNGANNSPPREMPSTAPAGETTAQETPAPAAVPGNAPTVSRGEDSAPARASSAGLSDRAHAAPRGPEMRPDAIGVFADHTVPASSPGNTPTVSRGQDSAPASASSAGLSDRAHAAPAGPEMRADAIGVFAAHAAPTSSLTAAQSTSAVAFANPPMHPGAANPTTPPAVSSSSTDTFAALDAASAPSASWVHTGTHRAEAGYLDPSLGWVSVRAESTSNALHAAIVPGTAEAAQALGTHLAGLNTYVAEQHGPGSQVTMDLPHSGNSSAAFGHDTPHSGNHSGSETAQHDAPRNQVGIPGNRAVETLNQTPRGAMASIANATAHSGRGTHISVMA